MKPEFKPDDLVWAQVKYFRPWPAKVVEPPAEATRKNCYYVFFYGSENFGWIKKKNICSYNVYYTDKFQPSFKNYQYTEAVKKIGEVYHEEIQLKSPTFQKIRAENDALEATDEDELVVEVENNEADVAMKTDDENDFDFFAGNKKKRTKEELEERRRKIQKALRVRLFPKKDKTYARKRLFQDEKNARKPRENKKVKKTANNNGAPEETITSSTISSSSSCIITVHFLDYKKVIPKEVRVLLRKIDQGIPKLTSDADEANINIPESQPDEPPILLPEI